MSRKVHGKGRSRGLSPEEFKKLADGLEPPGLISADEKAASTKKRLIPGLPAPRRPAKRDA
jgi:hypothetical protein